MYPSRTSTHLRRIPVRGVFELSFNSLEGRSEEHGIKFDFTSFNHSSQSPSESNGVYGFYTALASDDNLMESFYLIFVSDCLGVVEG